MVSHARESKYVCHFCDKAFYAENTLKVHFKKHLRMQVSDAERIGYVLSDSVNEVKLVICGHPTVHQQMFMYES